MASVVEAWPTLPDAIRAGILAMVNLLLDHGADINQRSDWWAGSFGVLDHGTDSMAAYILERGATLTPHAAARLGKTTALQQMIRADPGIVHARGGDGQFPLHFAQSPEIADLLLQNGADIDGRDVDHESTAAQWSGASRTRVAGHLVQRGCQTDPFLAAMVGDAGLLTRHLQDEPGGVNMRITRKRFPTTGKNAALHIYFYNLGEDCSLMHAAATADRVDVRDGSPATSKDEGSGSRKACLVKGLQCRNPPQLDCLVASKPI